ncbi:MAG: hypothetical protein WC761_01770 [Candidatus Paceibacterota bacterium]|jgi:hypothetical protein
MDDWEAKYWAAKQQQQTQQRPQQQRPFQGQPGPTGPANNFPEVDITGRLQQRMMSQQPASAEVYIREGTQYYRQVQGDGFGAAVPLVRSMGPLANVSGRQFAVMGDMRGYCIDNLQQIDLSKINEQPERMLMLVKVRAPFVGDILVPKTAVIENTSGTNKLLKG